jgi:hypothetical protein
MKFTDFLDSLDARIILNELEVKSGNESINELLATFEDVAKSNLFNPDLDKYQLLNAVACVYTHYRYHRNNILSSYTATATELADCWFLLDGDSYRFTLGNAYVLIKRFMATGFAKSGNINDLYKAFHYLFIEFSRGYFGRV